MTAQNAGTAEKIYSPARSATEGLGSDTSPIAEKVGHMGERAKGLYRRARERAIDIEDDFEGYVREHPVKAVVTASAVGAGVGLLVGFLVARR